MTMFRANAKDSLTRSDAADESTVQPPLSTHDRTAVIIPARNAVGLIEECLDSVVPQLRDEDVVYVIDDASTDGTGDVARIRGAHVIRSDVALGPYEARNIAAQLADVAHLVFFDVRCRAEDGWLDTHRKILSEGTNALSYSNVEVVKGRRLATRIAAAWRPFSIDNYRNGGYLLYFPTCNLGVSKEAFSAVGGFSQVRSGGDADLCWKVQESKLGEVGFSESTLVRWVPREKIKELSGQFYRYGRSSAYLCRERKQNPLVFRRILLLPARILWKSWSTFLNSNFDLSVATGAGWIQFAYERGYIRESLSADK
ncbi:glycosyltransferase [Prescottella equi]|uniref:glycosyltransferase n=1 Tax=Rhodococcus hoagii TaxID=43767 RepID=UPI000A1108CA|nr:glycosyltransferase [Prescottella equi]